MGKVVAMKAPEKPKRKLSATAKSARKKVRQEFMTVMIDGKQKRVRHPATNDGMQIDDFIRENADPIWRLQYGYWGQIKSLKNSD